MLPAESLAGFDSYAEELDQSMNQVLKLEIGDTVPDFTLTNHDGEQGICVCTLIELCLHDLSKSTLQSSLEEATPKMNWIK